MKKSNRIRVNWLINETSLFNLDSLAFTFLIWVEIEAGQHVIYLILYFILNLLALLFRLQLLLFLLLFFLSVLLCLLTLSFSLFIVFNFIFLLLIFLNLFHFLFALFLYLFISAVLHLIKVVGELDVSEFLRVILILLEVWQTSLRRTCIDNNRIPVNEG